MTDEKNILKIERMDNGGNHGDQYDVLCAVCSCDLHEDFFKFLQKLGIYSIICLDCLKNRKEEIDMKILVELVTQLKDLLRKLGCLPGKRSSFWFGSMTAGGIENIETKKLI